MADWTPFAELERERSTLAAEVKELKARARARARERDDALAAARALRAEGVELRDLLLEARDIVSDAAPGHTVWLDKVDAVLVRAEEVPDAE